MPTLTQRQPLQDVQSWHSRWLVLPSWRVLHRISEIEWSDPDDAIEGVGTAVCGAHGRFCIPGLFSRLGLRRCSKCCDALDIPRGDGAPFNSETEWKNA